MTADIVDGAVLCAEGALVDLRRMLRQDRPHAQGPPRSAEDAEQLGELSER